MLEKKLRCFIYKTLFIAGCFTFSSQLALAETEKAEFAKQSEGKGCLTCHEGVESIRDPNSEMMKQIAAKGAQVGDPNGCVVCHGGNPNEETDKTLAHKGAPEGNKLDFFTPVPGAMAVNDKTCGQCHQDHVYNTHRSIMNTDAGKMKAITWSWGMDTDNRKHTLGNHTIDDPDGNVPRFGTEEYKKYMLDLAKNHPDQFPEKLEGIPEITFEDVEKDPRLAGFSYLRNCNKCHLSNKGLQDRGHFRGDGCSACHTLYGTDGFYEGKDKSIDKENPGHMLVHSIQATRKSKVEVNGKTVSGIQVSTCSACHAGGRRIGYSYQGMMPYGHSDDRAPFDNEANGQKTHGGYTYKYIQGDAHHKVMKDGKVVGGLLCQDCHTSNTMHGNGNLGATTLASIEIECSDCHGTPTKYPWDLPIGFGDEFGKKLDMDKGRGLADAPMQVTKAFATVYPKKDGYLLSSRGNPLGNVVKDGKDVIVHSASGLDFKVPLLKRLEDENLWSNPEKARVAMVGVSKHMEKLECYACHATWAPQYYGSSYVIDYRKKDIDWVKAAEQVNPDGTTSDHDNPPLLDGKGTKFDYDHIRWEKPPVGINGEGRVAPLVGVIQTVGTVIGKDGKTLLSNYAPKTAEGYSAMELSPINPHTNSKQARECFDCHGDSMTAGYGDAKGKHGGKPSEAKYLDPVAPDGTLLSKHSTPQIQVIPGLDHGFDQILDKDGKQLQTVDSHWAQSSPLTAAQRGKLDRDETCIACHQGMPNMPDGSKAMTILGQVAKVLSLSFADGDAHKMLLSENNIIVAWFKALGIIMGVLGLFALIGYGIYFKRINAAIARFIKWLASKVS